MSPTPAARNGRFAMLALALTLSLALAACSGASSKATKVDTGNRSTLQAQLRAPTAADVTNAAGAMAKLTAYSGTMNLHVTTRGQTQVGLTMEIQVDNTRRLTKVDMSGATAHALTIISDGDTMYASAGGRWVKAVMDPAIRDQVLRQFDPSKSVIAQVSQLAGDLHPDGTATVGGVATNRWSGTLDVARLLQFIQALGSQGLTASQLASFGQNLSGTISIYLDGDGVLRQMTMEMAIAVPAQGTLHMSEDLVLHDLNREVSITPPSPTEIKQTVPNATFNDFANVIQQLETS